MVEGHAAQLQVGARCDVRTALIPERRDGIPQEPQLLGGDLPVGHLHTLGNQGLGFRLRFNLNPDTWVLGLQVQLFRIDLFVGQLHRVDALRYGLM